MARDLPTQNLDSLRTYIQEHDGLGDLLAAHTAPQDELQAAYDMFESCKLSAEMYRKDGYPFIADEYMARARTWARKWRQLNAEQAGG